MKDRFLSYTWNARSQRYQIVWHDDRVLVDIALECRELPQGYKDLSDVLYEAYAEVLKHGTICPRQKIVG